MNDVSSRGSHVHQVFHAARAQSEPVARVRPAQSQPNSAAACAQWSQARLRRSKYMVPAAPTIRKPTSASHAIATWM